MIETADWIFDPGPGVEDVAKPQCGVRGGEIVAEGTLEQVAANPRSFTGAYRKPMIERAQGAAE